jgi:hypothetical protein
VTFFWIALLFDHLFASKKVQKVQQRLREGIARVKTEIQRESTFVFNERAPAHRGPLRKPWSILAFPISESSNFFCGASWAPRATFKHIKKGGSFFFFFESSYFGRIFFLSKNQFLTPEMDLRAKT